jgi:hypothetical protein
VNKVPARTAHPDASLDFLTILERSFLKYEDKYSTDEL